MNGGLLGALKLKPKSKPSPLPDQQAQPILYRAAAASRSAREAGLDLGGQRDTLRKEVEDLALAKQYPAALNKVVTLEALARDGVAWAGRADELAAARTQAEQLRATGDPKATGMLSALTQAENMGTAARYADANNLLDGTQNAISKRQPEWRQVRLHNVEMGKLKPRLDNTIGAVPGRTDDTHALHPQWQALDAAIAACPAIVTDTLAIAAEDLEGRRATLIGALNTLSRAYAATPATGVAATALAAWGKAEAKALDSQFSTLFQKANYVRPRTAEQEELKKEFGALPRGGRSWAELLGNLEARAAKAEQLLRSVKRAEPLPDEKEYFRSFARISNLINAAVAEAGAPAEIKPADIMKAALEKAPQTQPKTAASEFQSQWAEFTRILETWNEDRYTQCLQLLPTLKLAAEAVMKPKVDAALDLVTKAPAPPATPLQVEQRAIAATTTIDPKVLKMLPPEKKVELMTALRTNGGPPPFIEDPSNANDPARVAQRAIYAAMELDDKFVAAEKSAREEFITELMKDKAALQKARDDWPLLSEAERIETFEKIMTAHCKAMKFAAPKNPTGGGKPFDVKVMYNDDGTVDKSTDAQYDPNTDKIEVNRNGAVFADFELMIDTIVHENCHNWQRKLIVRLEKPDNDPEKLKPTEDPPYTQALMFAANWNDKGFVTGEEDYAAYKKAPIEDHAWSAGPRTAAKLMKALA